MKRTPRGAPYSFESERLRFEAPDRRHGAIVAAGVVESIRELERFMEWAQETPTVESQRKVQAASRERFDADEEHSWLMFLRESETFLGFCGLPRPRFEEGTLEIGYWLRTSQTGHGYMSEAVRRVTRLCFEDLGVERVEIMMSELNLASARVAELAGFPHVETRRGDGAHPDGSIRDTRVYALERPSGGVDSAGRRSDTE
jgi:RimJ/RimL family protein N-acetyltransferase